MSYDMEGEALEAAGTASSFSIDDMEIERPRLKPRDYGNVNRELPSTRFDIPSFKLEYGDASRYAIKWNKKLGEGTYGAVFLATDRETKKSLVVKVFRPEKETEEKVKQEIKMICLMDGCPDIVRLVDLIEIKKSDHGSRGAVMEFIEGPAYNDLYKTFLDDQLAMEFYLYHLVSSLNCCHARGVIHRDVKGQNVLFDPKNYELRLIDWGFACFYHSRQPYRIFPGTQYFRAPELLLRFPFYDYSVDMWAFGCMLGSVLFRRLPMFYGGEVKQGRKEDDKTFRARKNRVQILAICRVLGLESLKRYYMKYKFSRRRIAQYPLKFFAVNGCPRMPIDFRTMVPKRTAHICSDEALDLLSRLLVWDHEERLTAKEALAHPFFERVRNMEYMMRRHETSSTTVEEAQDVTARARGVSFDPEGGGEPNDPPSDGGGFRPEDRDRDNFVSNGLPTGWRPAWKKRMKQLLSAQKRDGNFTLATLHSIDESITEERISNMTTKLRALRSAAKGNLEQALITHVVATFIKTTFPYDSKEWSGAVARAWRVVCVALRLDFKAKKEPVAAEPWTIAAKLLLDIPTPKTYAPPPALLTHGNKPGKREKNAKKNKKKKKKKGSPSKKSRTKSSGTTTSSSDEAGMDITTTFTTRAILTRSQNRARGLKAATPAEPAEPESGGSLASAGSAGRRDRHEQSEGTQRSAGSAGSAGSAASARSDPPSPKRRRHRRHRRRGKDSKWGKVVAAAESSTKVDVPAGDRAGASDASTGAATEGAGDTFLLSKSQVSTLSRRGRRKAKRKSSGSTVSESDEAASTSSYATKSGTVSSTKQDTEEEDGTQEETSS